MSNIAGNDNVSVYRVSQYKYSVSQKGVFVL